MAALQETVSLIESLQAIVGSSHVREDEASRVLYAQDVFTKGVPAALVVLPGNTQELAALVATATEANYAVIARGGGMSYTSGYVPVRSDTVIIDMSRMNRVLEINTEDMYVVVECGCTWEALYKALTGTGVRTPFWGTLSGSKASIGGGLSQNSIFWGSGHHGFAVDSVISMEVVLADGTIVVTGAAAQIQAKPFLRHYGPDLTGLFTGDTSALGCKATATLRLIPESTGRRFISLDFPDFASQSSAMSDVARCGLAAECFGFDPFLQSQRMKRDSLTTDVKSLAAVMKSAGGIGKSLKEGAKVALAGRRFMEKVQWSLHIMIEERTDEAAASVLERVRVIGKDNGGQEIENSIPKILRANPFGPVNNMVGPQGERWVPVHALVPHSMARQAYQVTCDIFELHRQAMDQFDINTGYLLATVSTNCFVLEPVFFWPDALTEIHRHSVEPEYLKKITGFDENLEARAVVTQVRKELVSAYRELGAVHLQIGKAYQYSEGLAAESLSLIKALKHAVDPNGLMNPGALGMGAEGE